MSNFTSHIKIGSETYDLANCKPLIIACNGSFLNLNSLNTDQSFTPNFKDAFTNRSITVQEFVDGVLNGRPVFFNMGMSSHNCYSVYAPVIVTISNQYIYFETNIFAIRADELFVNPPTLHLGRQNASIRRSDYSISGLARVIAKIY